MIPLPNQQAKDPPPFQGGKRLILFGLVAFVAGGLVTTLGFVLHPRQAFFSYLVAASYVVSIALGALIFLMIVHCADARWPILTRRLNEAISGTLPLYALCFIPVLFGLKALYAWTAPDQIVEEELRHLVEKKLRYLNDGFFIGRAVFYFVVWALVAALLRRWSLRQDRASGDAVARMKTLSALAFPAVGLTLTFAAFDWLMSLEPAWFSTMFGIYYFAGGFLSALAALTVAVYAAERAGALPGITPHHYYALGRLLLAFTIFWAYIAFFQYLIIWIADKPDEASWYVTRSHGGWGTASVVLVVVQFVVPFFALLPYRPKRSGAYLSAVSLWLLAAHYLDLHWLVMPTLHPEAFVLHWIDLAALVTLGGLGVAAAAWLYRGQAPWPTRDPRLAESFGYTSL